MGRDGGNEMKSGKVERGRQSPARLVKRGNQAETRQIPGREIARREREGKKGWVGSCMPASECRVASALVSRLLSYISSFLVIIRLAPTHSDTAPSTGLRKPRAQAE